jgi:hypothetical protein
LNQTSQEAQTAHRSDPSTRGSYARLPVEDLSPEIIDGQSFVTKINRPVWSSGVVSDTIIFSRKWYSILSDIVGGILIPPQGWTIVNFILLAVRVTSNFFIWYNKDQYPEVLFGFLLLQAGLSPIFDIFWFSSLFKLRFITPAIIAAVFFTLFYTSIFSARAVYHTDVGFGFSIVELLYYWYTVIITMIITKERRYTVFTDNDLFDITKMVPVTVYHDQSIHNIVPEDMFFARDRIAKALKTRKEGSVLYPHEIPGAQKYLEAYGYQAPNLQHTPTHKQMGWRT